MPNDILSFFDFAHDLADNARAITLGYFRHHHESQKKLDGSPVTIADKETEIALRRRIEQTYPTHGIIGEEHDEKNAQSEYEWIIDPIDGTKNFIAGYPLYGCLICLLKNNKPVLSIIDIPAQNERWSASSETSTIYRRDTVAKPVQTKQSSILEKATLCSTDYNMFTEVENKQLVNLRQSVANIRYNGDCYLYAMLASGWIDIVIESDLKVYDFLSLILVVEKAGGVITDWQGNSLNKNSSGQILATANKNLHQLALEKIHNQTLQP